MKITGSIGILKENLSSRDGAGGKTMRNLFGVHGENLSSRHGAGGKTMRNLFGIRNEDLKPNQRKGERTMPKTLGMRWLVVAAGAAMLLVLGAACTKEIEVPGETIIVEKEVVKTVEVPGETIVVEKEVVKTVEVPGQTVVVEKVVVKEVPGETVVVTKEVVREVPGQNYVFDPATGKTWTAPQYGGTLTWAAKHFPPGIDVWFNPGWAQHIISGVNEALSFADWAISRDIWAGGDVVTPEMTRGSLAERWSMPDDTTFIWKIRQGVHWDNKAPVNGREFDAYDVEWNYHRYLGLGDFTEDGPSPTGSSITYMPTSLESVTATDKWTVEIKLTKPPLYALDKMLSNGWIAHPREVVEKYGDAKDWRNVVGTGPLRLTDFLEGSSATWEKNPNYWGYDEKFPENRLPYIDEYTSLLMPDISTRLAALRTGKIDMVSGMGDTLIGSVDDVETLQRTNPEIEVWPRYGSHVTGVLNFNQSLPVMQDVNVRKALQMSVDRETISATYFKGWGDPSPYGLIQQGGVEGAYWPYEDWPEEVKQEYTYNPERAEELLDAAGHPRLADGYRFKVEIFQFDRWDETYPEVVMGYFEAIGVKSELEVYGVPELIATYSADTVEWELISGTYGHGLYEAYRTAHNIALMHHPARSYSFNKAKDPRIDALYSAAIETTDIEEFESIQRQADEIMVREHWALLKSSFPSFAVSQPWVEGYFGEFSLGLTQRNTHLARLWIDSELKEAMGR